MEHNHEHMDHMDHMDHNMHNSHAAHGHETVPDHGMHDGHNHGSSGEHGALHHMMMMTFHFGCKEVILFDQWDVDSVGGIIASVLVIALMAIFYEGLKYYREYLFWKTYNALQYRAVTLPDKATAVGASSEDTTRVNSMDSEVMHRQPPKMTSMMHIYQTFLHLIQVTLSFLLMLIFMTYNVWLCLGVVVGAAIGYFLFGWKKSVIVDITEHCH